MESLPAEIYIEEGKIAAQSAFLNGAISILYSTRDWK